MPQISRNALVMYSCKAIFDLVNDIENYPQFLPYCSHSSVVNRDGETVTGRVEIKKGPVSKSFTTCNRLVEPTHIHMQLVDGPFRRLNGVWLFTALDTHACKVELTLDYEFSSKLVEVAFGGIFKEVANSMVQAFIARAKVVYGEVL